MTNANRFDDQVLAQTGADTPNGNDVGIHIMDEGEGFVALPVDPLQRGHEAAMAVRDHHAAYTEETKLGRKVESRENTCWIGLGALATTGAIAMLNPSTATVESAGLASAGTLGAIYASHRASKSRNEQRSIKKKAEVSLAVRGVTLPEKMGDPYILEDGTRMIPPEKAGGHWPVDTTQRADKAAQAWAERTVDPVVGDGPVASPRR